MATDASKVRRKSGGDTETPSILSPATASPSSVVTTPSGASPRSGRSSSGSLFTFEAFRRRSKSDSKPNHGHGSSSTTSGTSTPSGIHRKSKLFHSFKNHIPWGRSASIDPAASSSGSNPGQSGSNQQPSSSGLSSRYHHVPKLPNHHHLDPYYTFTYGDTRQHNRTRSRSSSGGSSGVARVMDIFSRNKSGDSIKEMAEKYQTGPHRKSIDFGDLGEY